MKLVLICWFVFGLGVGAVTAMFATAYYIVREIDGR